MFDITPASYVTDVLAEAGFVVLLPGELPPGRVLEVADALLAAPVPVVEVIPNGPHALETVTALRQRAGRHMLVGAGRVESVAGLEAVIQAGAQFASSASAFRLPLLAHAKRAQFLYLPTVHAPGQTLVAHKAGCIWQKVRDDIDVEGLEGLQERAPAVHYIINQIPIAHIGPALAAGARLVCVNDIYLDDQQSQRALIRRARAARRACM